MTVPDCCCFWLYILSGFMPPQKKFQVNVSWMRYYINVHTDFGTLVHIWCWTMPQPERRLTRTQHCIVILKAGNDLVRSQFHDLLSLSHINPPSSPLTSNARNSEHLEYQHMTDLHTFPYGLTSLFSSNQFIRIMQPNAFAIPNHPLPNQPLTTYPPSTVQFTRKPRIGIAYFILILRQII